ncbi:helix-turn-helix transcriptional regulator, partial [Streptomyces noursei]|uniref:helix-turn-helix transcriptional regulator n=1 Tax=Streptomyces noursei TaxID=1971 RepID=UPI0035D8102D
MSEGQLDSVEALLEEARLMARMPEPAERLRLREAAGLSRAQVATAVGVGRQTVANWESGETDPQPPGRIKYLRLLEGLAQIHPAPARSAVQDPEPVAVTQSAPGAAVGPDFAAQTAWRPDGLAVQGEPGPCVRCGVPTPFQSTDGRPLHAGAMCQPPAVNPQASAPAPTALPPQAAVVQAAVTQAPVASPRTAPAPSPTPARVPSRPQRRAQSSARAQAETNTLIAGAVHE